MEEVLGMTRILGDHWRSQASATCVGVAPRRVATSDKVDDWSGMNPEWKQWHVGDAVTSKIGYECIIGSKREDAMILYADDRSDLSGFRDVRGRDVAKPDDMTRQTPLLEFGQSCHGCLDRPSAGPKVAAILSVVRAVGDRSSRCATI
ncbi:MAG TPA: hypothetical protein VN901_09415 [Candidatus Acidoferrales bacterium]|nr:hypothetical protein [Candidatus Acidoferrales bacterium]